MLPAHPSDDIALMVARTQLLDPTRVAEWEVPSDPAAVAPVRAACLRMLESWGLAAIDFTTELILSELITNAIRYGAQPIRVRLLYDRALICEVSDGTSASPHLRRAATTDEGGRGLFLVAQFAHRWGTRYTPGGKVIWTEQSLDGDRPEPGGRDRGRPRPVGRRAGTVRGGVLGGGPGAGSRPSPRLAGCSPSPLVKLVEGADG